MFRNVLIGCVALVAGSSLAIGAPQDDVKAAAQKLADAGSYSWKSTMKIASANNQPGPTEGKTEKDGYTMVTMTRGDNTMVVLRKGDKVVMKTPDGAWKTQEELQSDSNANGGRNPGRFLAQAGRVLPAKQAEELLSDVSSVTSTPDGFAGQLTEDGAKKNLTFGRRGGNNAPQVSNAKGDVKFMVKDGMLTGYELHVTGTVNRNGNDQDVDRTTTVEITDVGSTKVDAPDEAKKKLEG